MEHRCRLEGGAPSGQGNTAHDGRKLCDGVQLGIGSPFRNGYEGIEMTWIVGTLTPFGLGIVASDIRVTLSDRTEVNCLQKIYPLGGGLLGGFAGSVKIGFSLLQALAHESATLPKGKAWNLNIISNTWWPRLARRIYSLHNQREKNLGSQMILAGTHPNRNQGPFPETQMFTFSAPDFRPTKATTFASIGSGAHAPNCMRVVENGFGKLDPEFLMLHKAGFGVVAAAVGATLQQTIQDNPTRGISPLFQVGIVSRTLCRFHQYKTFFKADGTTAEFPELAKDYESLIRFCEKNRLNTVAVAC